MQRHLARTVLFDESAGGIIRDVSGVRLGRDGEIQHRLRQRQFTFRRAEAFVGCCRIVAQLDGARVGQTDVFPCHTHDAPRQIARIGTTVQHTHQPVQRGIGIGAAYRFVQCGNLIVERFATLVETAQFLRQRTVQKFCGDIG